VSADDTQQPPDDGAEVEETSPDEATRIVAAASDEASIDVDDGGDSDDALIDSDDPDTTTDDLDAMELGSFDPKIEGKKPGFLAWMTKNSVAANLIMALLILGGIVVGSGVKQEVFPEFDLNFINVRVVYPGAGPEEVERGIVQAIEDALQSIDGVKKMTSSAVEGAGSVTLELMDGVDETRILGDVKNAVDSVQSLPANAERPTTSLLVSRRRVVDLVIYGDLPEKSLKALAERARDDLLQLKEITQVDIDGIRPAEISIEVPQETLRAYGLTLNNIARVVASNSVELPGGGVKTDGGEVLVRTNERRDFGNEFEDIEIISQPDGTTVPLVDIATIKDSFEDTDEAAYFNGQRAVKLAVFRVGEQTPLEVAKATKDFAARLKGEVPPGVNVAIWQDQSEIYRDRIDLLLRNAGMGLILVLVILGLFLKPRLAFWVTMGIPISFLGSLLLMPVMDVSINMISLFAFIISLGMVVDDAIIVGENIFEMRQRGVDFMTAAIAGVRQVAVPVLFAIMTTVAAFMPMFLVPGISGKLFRNIPAIVVAVLIISLIESLFVLPAHLSHGDAVRERGLWKHLSGALKILFLPLWPVFFVFSKLNPACQAMLDWFIKKVYTPSVRVAVSWRYATFAMAFATLFVTCGVVGGGRIDFAFLPKVEGDRVTARAVLPFGSPVEETEKAQAQLVESAKQAFEELGGMTMSRGILTTLGKPLPSQGPVSYTAGLRGGHQTAVEVRLVPLDQRNFNTVEFTDLWRKKTGKIRGLELLTFSFNIGASGGSPVDIQLSHRDTNILRKAATEIAEKLETIQGVIDIDDGFSLGKPQLDFEVRRSAKAVGVTPQALAGQLRNSFYGAQASRQQRGRDDMRVMVRLPEEDRRSEYDVEGLIVQTPRGGEVPIDEAARVARGRAYTNINRVAGRRVVNVTADIEMGTTSGAKVTGEVRSQIMPDILKKYPGLTYSLEGEQAEQAASMGGLATGYLLALAIIFALLAVPFRSYLQPLVVMTAIPLGFVGAVAGHLLMGYELSMISFMGIVALSGVVVNDSLVLVAAANQYRDGGMTPYEAIIRAGARRFRPILLTSLTTFFGLAPMILETSVQARFLIPMAISLGFGVLFATFIILVVVPSSYMIAEDLKRGFGVGVYRFGDWRQRFRDGRANDDHSHEAPGEALNPV